MADLIQKELEKFVKLEEVMIFFGDHRVAKLKDRRIDNDHKLAYQSRVGPVEWLKSLLSWPERCEESPSCFSELCERAH
ncbi:hypothetical protein LWI28_012099 [Acer negundo]|uniref:Uncharacterized protein n=1 Tax=Acer negundo TaxID=4023 RepID=A0AAD5IMQ3_ACENE|nr:hypothetical protein LWI28_012099 [Acer negundo]KAK4850769.1 hypothetical protein QYF36_009685 [Acer negundo]